MRFAASAGDTDGAIEGIKETGLRSAEATVVRPALCRYGAHPNVCRVYDVGEIDGAPFLSMEYIDGEDLRSLLRRIGPISRKKGVAIARQLCQGAAAAHDRDVLHRDLKPGNVMIDGRGQARITDFGLADLAADDKQPQAGK